MATKANKKAAAKKLGKGKKLQSTKPLSYSFGASNPRA